MHDDEDRLFAALLRADVIDDAGFSKQIVARIRRDIWLRRLALPGAMLLGSAFAIKALLQLGSVFSVLNESLPVSQIELPATTLAQLPMLLTVGCLMLIAIVTFKLSEE
ncbi:MAG: hypothetical protein O2907_07250 [Proteobacteria bacterium]|nr:hypothetical protein [Pseudomonadota bacterium]MDA1064111.1 hypothetical protein [Pseudomonadota bacterium]